MPSRQSSTTPGARYFTYDYQRQSALGAWDEDPNLRGRGLSSASVLKTTPTKPRSANLHVDGDVGIADLVFAST